MNETYIRLLSIDGELWVRADQILTLQACPKDLTSGKTLITMIGNATFFVLDTPAEIAETIGKLPA